MTVGKTLTQPSPSEQSIIIMCGLPGSGKSTAALHLARKHCAYVVDKDSLRTTLYGGAYDFVHQDEQQIISPAAHFLTHQLLDEGYSVVLDDTNLTKEKRAPHIAEARRRGVHVQIAYCATSVEECIARRKIEHRGLGGGRWKRVILEMASTFEPPTSDECEVINV